jgi:hypothetical protein
LCFKRDGEEDIAEQGSQSENDRDCPEYLHGLSALASKIARIEAWAAIIHVYLFDLLAR